jgi:pilus assembly protein CpaF
MRPDRILLGEIRKENAFAFCSAINTGHEGSMATIHSNSPDAALDAVVNRVMLNGEIADSALNVLRRQLEADIYGVVQLTREGPRVTGQFKVLKTNT